MSISQEELKREKTYLLKVKSVLERLIQEGMKAIDYKTSSINELKKFMWDNISDYTDEERGVALYEVDRSVDTTNEKIADVNKYKKALDSPYFAKIVFEDDEFEDEMTIYIGMKSVQEGIDFYVYDWRAPISSMFYNYELGEAEYQAPNGKITGKILSKFQFKIQEGKLIRCFKSDINIDDEYLQEVLSNSSTDKMKNIVSTIQREQNTIIRNDDDQYLVVQGVAGSGKTSVALHRIAYLLYKDLALKSNNVLIFSPNDVFSDYISNVLPELGEENVLKSTFNEFALAYLKPYKKIESYSEFLERVYSNKPSIEEERALTYKMSDQCKNDIDDFIENYENAIDFGNGFTLKGRIFTGSQLKELFAIKYKKLPYKERLETIAEYICNTAGLSVRKNSKQVLRYLQDITGITYNQFDLYKSFLSSKDIANRTIQEKIPYEDITPLLYLYFKVNGFPNYNYIRQVVIDEAQDYSKFQIEMLKSIFKSASFTILGDIHQTINPYYRYRSLRELEEVFTKARYLELNKTYRSSEEIIDYSNQVLGLSNVCAIRRNTNIEVETKEVPDSKLKETIAKDIENMNELGIKKIAIITRDMIDANKVYKLIRTAKEDTVQLISSSTHSVSSPIVVIPSYLSKGLEFDGVIACNNSERNYEDTERNLYYVVCTRAQHKLNVYNEPAKVLQKTITKNVE